MKQSGNNGKAEHARLWSKFENNMNQCFTNQVIFVGGVGVSLTIKFSLSDIEVLIASLMPCVVHCDGHTELLQR